MPSWIQCPVTHKLIPRDEYQRDMPQFPVVHGDIESFRSPVDGSIISDRKQLREHNRRHGVTDQRDYGPNWFKRKEKERESTLRGDSRQAKQDRVSEIQKAIAIHEARYDR